MKIRYPVRCEWCKVWLHPGEKGVRMYKRVWHHDCVHQYYARRHAPSLTHAGAPGR